MAGKNFKTPFVKGNQYSKGHGRPKLEAEDRLNEEIFSAKSKVMLLEVCSMPVKELFLQAQNTEQPALRAAMCSVLNNCIQIGDGKLLEMFLNRILGKVRDVLKVETDKPTEAQEYEAVKLELLGLISQGLQ